MINNKGDAGGKRGGIPVQTQSQATEIYRTALLVASIGSICFLFNVTIDISLLQGSLPPKCLSLSEKH